MKIKILIPFLTLLFLLPISSCKKVDTTEEVPGCIKRKIRKYSKKGRLNYVTKYEKNGNVFYAFSFNSITGGSDLLDSDCNELCTSGTETSDFCKEIFKDVTNSKIIWE